MLLFKNWHWRGLLVFVALAGARGVGAQTPAESETPASENQALPKSESGAAKLKKALAVSTMQAVYDSFAWVDTAKTLRIRTQYKIVHTKDGLAQGKIDPRPFYLITDLAWDQTHIREHSQSYLEEAEDKVHQSTKIWDGQLGVTVTGPPDSPNYYALGDKIASFFSENMTHMAYRPWGPGGPHNTWWLPTDVARWRSDWAITPEDFELVGEEDLNGRRCRVLESRVGHYRMHVGADDGRLYRRTCLYVFTKDPKYDYLKLLQKVGGPDIKTTKDWQPWLKRLSHAEQIRVGRELKLAEFEFTRPIFYQDFDDYREVAPGCSMPFCLTTEHHNLFVDKPFIDYHNEQIVTDVAVNQPIEDKLFKIELINGVKVSNDSRYSPSIEYLYDDQQTEAERQALCEAKKKEQEKRAAK